MSTAVKKNSSGVRRLLTAIEVAEMLGVPVACLYHWRLQGRGPLASKVGKYLRYRREDVEAWITAQQG